MIDIFDIKQHSDFPNIIYGIVTQKKGSNAVNFLGYDDIYTFLSKINLPYYFGIVPHTYNEEFPTFILLDSNYDLPIFSTLELLPLYLISLPLNGIKFVVFSKIKDENIKREKEEILSNLSNFFGIEESEININGDPLDHLKASYNRYMIRFREKL